MLRPFRFAGCPVLAFLWLGRASDYRFDVPRTIFFTFRFSAPRA